MRRLAISATGAFLILTPSAGATPLSPPALGSDHLSAIALAQAKPKKEETLTQKVKRVWRDLTGYKFTISCPAFPIPIRTHHETGSDDAQPTLSQPTARNHFIC